MLLIGDKSQAFILSYIRRESYRNKSSLVIVFIWFSRTVEFWIGTLWKIRLSAWLALKNRVNLLSRMNEAMQHANTHLEISYLARCFLKLVKCFWLYIYPKFYFCCLLTFCGWLHTCPNEMISQFRSTGLAEKLPDVLCRRYASFPGLNTFQLKHLAHPSSRFGCLPDRAFIFEPSGVVQWSLPTSRPWDWLCSKDLSAALSQHIWWTQNHEMGHWGIW